MAFVRKVKTASGATAVQIAERRDGRDKVLEHIGSAHTEAELFALVTTARRRLQPFQDELDFLPPVDTGRSYPVMQKRSTALWNTLHPPPNTSSTLSTSPGRHTKLARSRSSAASRRAPRRWSTGWSTSCREWEERIGRAIAPLLSALSSSEQDALRAAVPILQELTDS